MAATKKLIVEKGYSDMTTKDIAKEANVNEATLFRQFGSKKNYCWRHYEKQIGFLQ